LFKPKIVFNDGKGQNNKSDVEKNNNITLISQINLSQMDTLLAKPYLRYPLLMHLDYLLHIPLHQ